MKRVGIPLTLIALCLIALPGSAAEFPLQEGDVWIFAGDSITAQKQHTNYFEAFCYARYPKMTFAFRNSGIGGDTIPKVIARFNYDVAAWHPTVVSVELGMNDKGGTSTEQYIQNMGKLAGMIQEAKARPVFFAASPVNNGATMDKLDGGNQRLHEYAEALKKFSAEQKSPFGDQFHALVDVWGKNKSREQLANALLTLRAMAKDDKLDGVDHLRKFIEVQDQNKTAPVSMMGDPVHPGQTGQLMMAAALLKSLGAKEFVSSAVIEAGKAGEAKGCEITNVKLDKDVLTFDRMDECLPFPIPEEARPVVAFDPTILEMSRYTLKVTGLKSGKYQVKVNGADVAVITSEDLAKGVNLTRYGTGPIAAQGKEILGAVAAKEGLVQQWRALSKTGSAKDASPEDKQKLDEMTKKVKEADAKIRESARAKKLSFELSAAK